MALLDFGRSVNPSQSEGADYFPNYNWQPRTFQTFLQPWQCNAISASISSNVLHQMMLTSKLILDNKIGAFDEKLGLISYTYRAVVPGCAGCAMAHPDFGRSVNPISTRGDRLCQPNYYWHTQIFRPYDGPAYPTFVRRQYFIQILQPMIKK